NPYRTVPGRTMMVLVRDAAAPFHPVVGIAALSSSAVAVTVRDEKIGWTADGVIAEMTERPTPKLAAWFRKTVDDAIGEIYKVDLLEDKLLSLRQLEQPTDETLRVLREEGKRCRRQHHRFMESGEYKKAESADSLPDEHWEAQARWPLFRSKRALELANLLFVRMVLRRFFEGAPSKAALSELVGDGAGRDAVAKIVRKAKADRVGTAMADLTICGAVPPYNEVLGGKLVAMLMVSPEVVGEYRRRYGGLPSVIASSMAGRPIRRPAALAFIGTTSLYGQRPSQYDRISIPRDPNAPDPPSGLRYEYLGRTRGIGTFQFNDRTVAELAVLLAQSKRGQQVNSVFGEGVNPRLRKIRDGLDALGLPTDDLLNHGGPRLVYGVELTENTRAYLLGMDKHPRYILGRKNPKLQTQEIARWWMRRWLLPRIEREDVLARVAAHNFVHPIRHGARVVLPKAELYY
ncbi:MAG TPA: Druantia anti-phage system protein DruA, partial [Gemmataceae bacterium]|nr:Druantia anti-phage system protein DruA [Gemmataceae bacterium]